MIDNSSSKSHYHIMPFDISLSICMFYMIDDDSGCIDLDILLSSRRSYLLIFNTIPSDATGAIGASADVPLT